MARRDLYTEEQVRFLTICYRRWRIPELTRRFNARFGASRPPAAIRSALRNRHIVSGRRQGFKPMECLQIMTLDQAHWVAEHYKVYPVPKLTAAFNEKFSMALTTDQIKHFVKNHNMPSGRTGQFYVGQPYNPKAKMHGPNSTSFVKGSVPANVRELGHERTDTNGYIWVKVAEPNPYTGAQTRYRQKNHLVWEATMGRPVNPSHVLVFRDGVRANCEFANLIEVSRLELVYLNKHSFGELTDLELRDSLRAIAALECRRYQLERELREMNP